VTRLELPIHGQISFVLVRPHYPENVGACARAIKTMGFSELVLVKPSRLAVPEHEMAFKMAVRAWDVLHAARRCETLEEALTNIDLTVATSSHRGISGVLTARQAALEIGKRCAQGQRAALLFGNEKTGLSAEEVASANLCLRIPMVADQPSINLAQAVQIVAYELLVAALEARSGAT
jgi:TrmH family RNA methyltransferase